MPMQRTPLLMSRLMDRGGWIAPEEEIVTRTAAGTHRMTYSESSARAHRLAGALAQFCRDRAGAGIFVHHDPEQTV